MDVKRLTQEHLGFVYELAVSHLASLIYEHMAHERVPNSDRWNIDSKVARENLHLPDIVLWAWTRDFVNTLAYIGHWGLYDEMHKREITLQEASGINSGEYVSGISDQEFYRIRDGFSYDQKRFLFGKLHGQQIWDHDVFPLMFRGRLRPLGFYFRERQAA